MKYQRPKNIPGLIFNLMLLGSLIAVKISDDFFPIYMMFFSGYGILYAIIVKKTWKARFLRMTYVTGITVILYSAYASWILEWDMTWFYAIGMFLTGIGLIYFNES
jgi:hypothetical protein